MCNNNLTIETKYPHPSNIHDIINNGEGLGVEIRELIFNFFFLEDNNKIRHKYSLCEHFL